MIKLILLLLITVANQSIAKSFNQEEAIYSQPIKFASQNLAKIEEIITRSLHLRSWKVKEKKPNKMIVWLDNYKGYELTIEISYDDSKIYFTPINFKVVDCNRCKAKKKYYETWRLNLRATLASELHKEAMIESLTNPSIRKKWLEKFRTGNEDQKLRSVRYIIELELFDESVLEVIADEVDKNHTRKLSSDETQIYAFYCKALALSKVQQYKTLLVKVKENTPTKKLRSYVKGYLKNYY